MVIRAGRLVAVCDIDLKVGGAFRYVWRRPNGTEMGMRGVFRDVVPPERIVHTESFDEPWYPGEALDTIVLAEQDGKTTLTLTVLYESQEARDAVLKTQMEDGMAMGYDRLAELLASPGAVLTKEELTRSLQNEVRLLLHLGVLHWRSPLLLSSIFWSNGERRNRQAGILFLLP